MNTPEYPTIDENNIAPHFNQLIRAEDAVARLDERLRRTPLASAWAQRLLYGEACANRMAQGKRSANGRSFPA